MANAPLPPKERVGYALVGLGELSFSEILPALQESQVSRLGALVSDDMAQARDIARRYGLPEHRVKLGEQAPPAGASRFSAISGMSQLTHC